MTEKSDVHLDDILEKFGSFKRYHVQILVLLGVSYLINGMHCINFIFVAEDSPYRCKIDQCESPNITFDSPWYNYTSPHEYRTCNKYATLDNSTECLPEKFNTSHLEPCKEWIYEKNNSFVAEFGLACEDYKRTFVGTIHSFGLMFGLLFQGFLSDKVGRKAAIILSGLAAAVFGIAKSFANTYYVYIFLELLESFFGDSCSPTFIMTVEIVDKNNRLKQQIVLVILYSIGGIFIAVAAYLVEYWRNFILVIYAPSFIFLLYIFLMDESPRWLLSKGRKDEAVKVLRKMAKKNRVDIDEKMFINLKAEDNVEVKKSPLIETFNSKIVIKRFCICQIWWVSCTFICFGLLINAVTLAGNKYVNFVIMSLCDIPVSFLVVYFLNRFNRKKPLLYSFIIAGLLVIAQGFVPKVYPSISISLYLSGKILSVFTFTTIYLYTSELFPTYSRNFMHALCSSVGRVGSVLAPMTPLLLQYGESIPTFLFGGISIFAGLCTLFMPDIANEALPDNVRQAECIGTPCHIGVHVEKDKEKS